MQFHMHYMQNTNYVGNRAYMISSTGLSLTHCHVIKNANTTLLLKCTRNFHAPGVHAGFDAGGPLPWWPPVDGEFPST
jgi:hypothetical protein